MARRKRRKKSDKNEAYLILGVLTVVLVLATLPSWTNSFGELLPTFLQYGILLVLGIVAIAIARWSLIILRKKKGQRIRDKRFGNIKRIDEFAHMDGFEFEKYIAWYYEQKGYKASTTVDRGDHGIDLFIEKDGEKIPVQTKKYKRGNNVGEPAIRDFVGSIRKYHRGIFITTSNFTRAAYDYADTECPELELIHGNKLIELVHSI